MKPPRSRESKSGELFITEDKITTILKITIITPVLDKQKQEGAQVKCRYNTGIHAENRYIGVPDEVVGVSRPD